ncbi:PREDICTED: uncharacterized protein LOC104783832 [Camelina sativa]|uniref:Uncharacterized protein LOC104783832 n=1 Tax=Camelina sativa TaxID=90675 RepID=A0ABM0YX59_CAMSA|nr:PREDICTED: uncharacterized protein LOC104783832 [Camelina sativa]
MGRKVVKAKPELILKEDDPLFGVLREDQVGLHPLLGRPRIAPDVLEGMRQYLRLANAEDKALKIEKVKKSVADAEKDPIAQKTVLRLEPAPIISTDYSRGKGLVFGYDTSVVESSQPANTYGIGKLLSGAIQAERNRLKSQASSEVLLGTQAVVDYPLSSSSFQSCPTAYVKSRRLWHNSGDKNTKFFHASVKADRSNNGLEALLDEDEILHRAEASKGEVAISYFENLFSSSFPVDPSALFEGFLPRVTIPMNDKLMSKVLKEEVREAVFSIKAASAPGADGMTGLFFQQYWDIVGKQLTLEVQRFFDEGFFQSEWNFTQICLIPKKVNSVLMSDLRPISMCSVMYKVISTIMVSRLQPFLPDLVSPNQLAFVEDRLISDNIIKAHEVVHGLRTHDAISKKFMEIKTDMSKASDRIEWSYLHHLLLALGFHSSWVDLIIKCVTSVTYTVLINGQPHGMVFPERGLRQGDPLSPFLFVLCAEGLTHLLNKAEQQRLISGMSFSVDGPSIHHLLFADDTLFVCKAEEAQCVAINNILKIYGEATGQMINLDKSSITFAAKVEEGIKAQVKAIMGIDKEGGAGTYLGLPECFSGSKTDMLEYINDRMKNRLSGWFARSLSSGGKEILLKTVAMAMPVFAMSCFKLPKSTCDSLSSAMSSFWWSSIENQRKIHWIAWDRLCLRKDQGGLDFKDIELFNQALLAKQAWRLLQDSDSLFSRFLKSRYYENSSFLSAECGRRPSFAWRSILHGRDLLELGLKQRVGDGAFIKVWSTPWLEDAGMRVNEKHTGRFGTISQGFNRSNHERLESFGFGGEFFPTGDYTIRSGYWLACQTFREEEIILATMLPSLNEIKDQIWKLLAPSKLKIFIWKAASGALPVLERLNSRGMKLDPLCETCGMEGESINHLLFECSFARQVWAVAGFPLPENGFDKISIYQNLHLVFSICKNVQLSLQIKRYLPWILWLMWKNRNNLVFEGNVYLITDLVKKIREDAEEWFQAQKLDEKEETSSWDKDKAISGAAWVLRNSEGTVLLHSRHSFALIRSKEKAALQSSLWAMESMKSLHIPRVIFALENAELEGVKNRPSAWPNYKLQAEKLALALSFISDWKAICETRKANLGAFLIAKSVTSGE